MTGEVRAMPLHLEEYDVSADAWRTVLPPVAMEPIRRPTVAAVALSTVIIVGCALALVALQWWS